MTGFFDGTEQNGCCGARMVIKLKQNHLYNLRMVVGIGSNTNVELVAMWGLL